MEISFPFHDLNFDLSYNYHYHYNFSSSFHKFQNDHHLLKFYLSVSCKSLNNSQMVRLYHISLWIAYFLSYLVSSRQKKLKTYCTILSGTPCTSKRNLHGLLFIMIWTYPRGLKLNLISKLCVTLQSSIIMKYCAWSV